MYRSGNSGRYDRAETQMRLYEAQRQAEINARANGSKGTNGNSRDALAKRVAKLAQTQRK